MRFSGFQRFLPSQSVHVRQHKDFTGLTILNNGGQQPAAVF
jgi:hypothetical protein